MDAKKNTNLAASNRKSSEFIQRLGLVAKPLGYSVSSLDLGESGIVYNLESDRIVVTVKPAPQRNTLAAADDIVLSGLYKRNNKKPWFTIHFCFESIELENHLESVLESHNSVGLLLAPQNQVSMKVFRSLLYYLSSEGVELSPRFLVDSQAIYGESFVTTYEQKNEVLAAIIDSIQAAARPTAPQWLRKLMNRVSLVTDELILNTGVKSRVSDIVPAPHSYDASVQWAHDGESLVVAISDFSGTLTRENITETLFRKGMKKEGEIVAGGLGFKTVWNATQDLVILVRPNELTRVICRFPLSAESTAYQSSSLWLLCP